jgi:hypothetical protein
MAAAEPLQQAKSKSPMAAMSRQRPFGPAWWVSLTGQEQPVVVASQIARNEVGLMCRTRPAKGAFLTSKFSQRTHRHARNGLTAGALTMRS